MGAEGTDNAQAVTDLHVDCYAILGVLPSAENGVIDDAYETLAHRYDAERLTGSAEEAQRKLSELANAYAILSDPLRRRRYDLRRRIDALVAMRAASDAPRQKKPSPAPASRSYADIRPRRSQVVLPALMGALIVVAFAVAFQYSGRPTEERQATSLASPPVAADAKPAPITQSTPPSAETQAKPSDAGASGMITTAPAPQAAAPPQQETKPARPNPAVTKNPPLTRGGDASSGPAISESCSDVAAVLGLCKRKSTVKDK